MLSLCQNSSEPVIVSGSQVAKHVQDILSLSRISHLCSQYPTSVNKLCPGYPTSVQDIPPPSRIFQSCQDIPPISRISCLSPGYPTTLSCLPSATNMWLLLPFLHFYTSRCSPTKIDADIFIDGLIWAIPGIFLCEEGLNQIDCVKKIVWHCFL